MNPAGNDHEWTESVRNEGNRAGGHDARPPQWLDTAPDHAEMNYPSQNVSGTDIFNPTRPGTCGNSDRHFSVVCRHPLGGPGRCAFSEVRNVRAPSVAHSFRHRTSRELMILSPWS